MKRLAFLRSTPAEVVAIRIALWFNGMRAAEKSPPAMSLAMLLEGLRISDNQQDPWKTNSEYLPPILCVWMA